MKYKFLGSGIDSPKEIEFMGLVRFKIGEAVEVSDPYVLDKLKSHKFFELVSDGIKDDVIDIELDEVIEAPQPKKRGRPAKAE